MTSTQAFSSGLTGALVLTAVHETVRQGSAKAPRMDIYASRGIVRSMRALGQKPPSGDQLYGTAMAGDVLANTLYYSLVGLGKPERAPYRGALLGLAAGVGAVVLPPLMGLGRAPSRRTRSTQAMTVGWYLLGGLVAGASYRLAATKGFSGEALS